MIKVEVVRIAQYDDDKGLGLLAYLGELAKRKQRVPTMQEISQRLIHSNQWEKEKEMYPCWAGPLVVHEVPDKPFGKTVEWEGLTVHVPKKWQGKANLVILDAHPDFKRQGSVFWPGPKAQARPMPKEDGCWYDVDPIFEYPIGEPKDYSDSRRRLWRRTSSPYIGLVARGGVWYGYDRRGVSCYYVPSYRLGVFGTPIGKSSSEPAKYDGFLAWLDKTKNPSKKAIKAHYLKWMVED